MRTNPPKSRRDAAERRRADRPAQARRPRRPQSRPPPMPREPAAKAAPPPPEPYEPVTATPTEKLKQLMVFRAVHPLYGLFLMDYLGKADDARADPDPRKPAGDARLGGQVRARALARRAAARAGSATEVVDPAILTSGLATQEDLYPPGRPERRAARAAQVPGPAGAEDADAVRERRSTTPAACSSPPSGPSATCSRTAATSTSSSAPATWSSRKASSSSTCCG